MNFIEMLPIGIEEELQVVDPATGELSDGAPGILALAPLGPECCLKPETHTCMLEIATGVCHGLAKARENLLHLNSEAQKLARMVGFVLLRGGSHPTTDWRTTTLTKDPHVDYLLKKLGNKLRKNVFFGLHVHVGICDREAAAYVANRMLPYLPVLLALSANSRFFGGKDTGFASWRAKSLLAIPLTGTPPAFSTYRKYWEMIERLHSQEKLENPKDAVWDLRIHPIFETIEVRICDVPQTVDQSVALAGLIREMARKFYDEYQRGIPLPRMNRSTIRKNRMEAARLGMDAVFKSLPGIGDIGAAQAATGLLELIKDSEENKEDFQFIKSQIEHVGIPNSGRGVKK